MSYDSNWSKRQVVIGGVLAMISVNALSTPGNQMSKRQNAIIWGNILGDGHLQLSPNQQKVRLRYDHGAKQAEYVNWQYQQLGWLCDGVSPPKIITEREYLKCRAYTKYLQELKPYHELTYVASTKANRRFEKILPLDLAKYLKDPEILMIWYLDDGTFRPDGGACRLATQGFTLEEHVILQDCLKQNFDIISVIEKWPKGKAGLYIPKRGAAHFVNLFSSTVKTEIPSMKYKLGFYI